MSLIIDGYNLLHEAGILGAATGPGNLERARLALLNFLAESLTPREIQHTTVVFDAKDAPWGAKSTVDHRGITVLFAARWPDADCLIEELIRDNSAPKRLTVVSSDNRLQRAAARRKAKAVDSELWYSQLVQERNARRQKVPAAPERPCVPLLAEDVDYWVRQFGGQSELERWMKEEVSAGQSAANRPTQEPAKQDALKDDLLLDTMNPFPPGYAEDLQE
jgi:predicted RNA-binding protein with PIN domain